MTAIATDMSLRDGWGYQAGGADPLPTRHLVNYQRQQLGLADDAPGVVFDVADFGVVRGLLAGAGVGARGVVVVQSSVSEVSHAFNVVRDVRGVTFLDGQAGRLAVAPGSVVAVKFLPMTVGLVAPAGVRVSDGSELVGLTGADPDRQPVFRVAEGVSEPAPGQRTAPDTPAITGEVPGWHGRLTLTDPAVLEWVAELVHETATRLETGPDGPAGEAERSRMVDRLVTQVAERVGFPPPRLLAGPGNGVRFDHAQWTVVLDRLPETADALLSTVMHNLVRAELYFRAGEDLAIREPTADSADATTDGWPEVVKARVAMLDADAANAIEASAPAMLAPLDYAVLTKGLDRFTSAELMVIEQGLRDRAGNGEDDESGANVSVMADVLARHRSDRGVFTDFENQENGRAYLSLAIDIEIADATVHGVQRVVRDKVSKHLQAAQRIERGAELPTDLVAAIEKQFAADGLTADLPTIAARSGASYVVGEGDHAVVVTVRAEVGHPPPGSVVTHNDAERTTAADTRNASATVVSSSHQAQTFRDLPLNLRPLFGLGKLPVLKTMSFLFGGAITHNQFRRAATVEVGVNATQYLRTREPHYAHEFSVKWFVTVQSPEGGDAGVLDGVPPDPAVDHDRIRLKLPQHIVTPQRWRAGIDPALPTADELIAEPAVVLDTVQDPGSLLTDLVARLRETGPDGSADGRRVLADLHVESLRALTRFVHASNLQGGFDRLRTDGLLSDPLWTSDGRPLGMVRLRAEAKPVRQVSRTPSRFEMYFLNRLGDFGSSALRNARTFTFAPGFSFASKSKHLDDLRKAGSYHLGGTALQGRWGWGSRHSQEGGGLASVMRGLKSERDVLVMDADVVWTATLERGQAGNPVRAEWTGTSDQGQGLRLRYAPMPLEDADETGTLAPADIDRGTGSGYSVLTGFRMDTRIAQEQTLDASLAAELRRQGFLPNGTDPTALQLQNLREFEDVRSAYVREQNYDELMADGIWLPMLRPTQWGTERVFVRWWATRDDTPAVHRGRSGSLSMFAGTELDADVTGSLMDTGTLEGRLQADVSIGLGRKATAKKVPSLSATAAPVGYGWESNRTMSVGSSFGREVIMESDSDGTLHGFDVGLHVHAALYWPDSNTPAWEYSRGPAVAQMTYQQASVRVLVPQDRVERAPQGAVAGQRVGPTLSPVPVTPEHRRALERAPAGLLPTLPGAVRVGGSAALNAMFRDLLIAVFGGPRGAWWSSLVGPSPASDATMSAQIRRHFVSPTRLRANLDQMLRGVHSSDLLFESGAMRQDEGWLELRAFQHAAPTFKTKMPLYIEDSGVVTEAGGHGWQHRGSWLGDVSVGPAVTASRIWSVAPSVTLSGSRGERRTEGDMMSTTDLRVLTTSEDMYTITIPLTYIGTARGGWRALPLAPFTPFDPTRPSWEHSQALVVDDAVEAYVTFRELYEVWTAQAAAFPDTPPADRIVGLPHDVLARLLEEEATRGRDSAARTAGEQPVGSLDNADPADTSDPDRTVRYPPRRLAARLGLGEGVVVDVRQIQPSTPAPAGAPMLGTPTGGLLPTHHAYPPPPIGTGTAGGPAAVWGSVAGRMSAMWQTASGWLAATPPTSNLASGRALYESGLNAVEAVVPGVTIPGSSTFQPGVHQAIADLSSPMVLRGAVAGFFTSGTATPDAPVDMVSLPFVTTQHGGAVQGEVVLSVRPVDGYRTFDELRKVFGRIVHGGGLEVYQQVTTALSRATSLLRGGPSAPRRRSRFRADRTPCARMHPRSTLWCHGRGHAMRPAGRTRTGWRSRESTVRPPSTSRWRWPSRSGPPRWRRRR
ncbi:hypothetical protein [Dactylosporangium darangshiense]|uniref:hypothetical protein n=1 Tax=Dactylosporangium darangshiense TaxID=579108 RepID=UPI003635F0B2